MTLTTLLALLVFLIGIYFYIMYGTDNYAEGFTGKPRCPNMLIQKGSKFYLYNSKLAQVPGVNPIEFDNLEDYTEFLDWQRSQGIRCPVLYLQSTYDAQGNNVYKVRPSITDPQYGLPPSSNPPIGVASTSSEPIMESSLSSDYLNPNPTLLVDAGRNDPPYNQGSYPGYDQSSYYVGTTTPLDKMDADQENAEISPNAMDSNWGGAKYTQKLVDNGYYAGNEVNIRIP
jgi:hypothetical protein